MIEKDIPAHLYRQFPGFGGFAWLYRRVRVRVENLLNQQRVDVAAIHNMLSAVNGV